MNEWHISKRLSVFGPDSDGDYELTLESLDCGESPYSHFITREEADALIAALRPPTPDRLPRAEDGTPIHPAPDQDPR